MALEPIDEKDLNLQGKFTEGLLEGDVIKKDRLTENKENTVENEKVAESRIAYEKIVAKMKDFSREIPHSEIVHGAAHIGSFMDIESKITTLVDIAMQKGVLYAVKVARHLDDNYILDKLHDELVMDELYHALLEKGIIKDM